jgi:hypothetical protein
VFANPKQHIDIWAEWDPQANRAAVAPVGIELKVEYKKGTWDQRPTALPQRLTEDILQFRNGDRTLKGNYMAPGQLRPTIYCIGFTQDLLDTIYDPTAPDPAPVDMVLKNKKRWKDLYDTDATIPVSFYRLQDAMSIRPDGPPGNYWLVWWQRTF